MFLINIRILNSKNKILVIYNNLHLDTGKLYVKIRMQYCHITSDIILAMFKYICIGNTFLQTANTKEML